MAHATIGPQLALRKPKISESLGAGRIPRLLFWPAFFPTCCSAQMAHLPRLFFRWSGCQATCQVTCQATSCRWLIRRPIRLPIRRLIRRLIKRTKNRFRGICRRPRDPTEDAPGDPARPQSPESQPRPAKTRPVQPTKQLGPNLPD